MNRAIGMVEFSSIARGIYSADQMVKRSDVEIVTACSTCPGKYIAVVHGDVTAVRESVETGVETAGEFIVEHIMIPNVHKDVFPAIVGATSPEKIDALGILESYSMSGMVIAADLALKSAELEAIEIRLGTGLGGKAFFTFTGDVAAVKNGIEVGMDSLGEKGMLLNAEVIPQPSERIISSLY
ncbi:MAG: BMC domain-containing protein [Ruminococcaceae bacterium]|mgnify:CR=1 FL=1|nr:BMC domain-containing protein [Oscillospiraceae bacterium]